ncbi:MAG: hypothetical protein ACTSO9_06860 [Candidatus Helarchaeota archaeon]
MQQPSSKQVFATHVYDLTIRPGYYQRTWKLINKKMPVKGAFGHFMSRDLRVIVIKILYNSNYPENPPKIISTPPIRDVCWDNKGVLHWAKWGDQFVWSKYKDHSNPLIYLADEITEKYKTM